MAELAVRSDGQAVSVGVCEDDHPLRDVLRRALSAEGYTVRLTASGEEAIEAFTADPPQLLVLDITLADRDGREVCAALRDHGLDLPVLFLSGRRELDDRLAAFETGADDYLTKPFELEELLARARGLLRRAGARRHDEPIDDGLRLDAATHAVVLGDREVPLTRTEFRVLATLLAPGPRSSTAPCWPPPPGPTLRTPPRTRSIRASPGCAASCGAPEATWPSPRCAASATGCPERVALSHFDARFEWHPALSRGPSPAAVADDQVGGDPGEEAGGEHRQAEQPVPGAP